MDFIRYKTSSPAGDLISFLAGIKQMYKKTGKRGLVYQMLDVPGVSYSDSIHPFLNDNGQPICMNDYMFGMLQPLLRSQEYIEDYIIYKGEEVDFDFDMIRQERFTNQPRGSLNRWFNYVFPQMASDLSKKWVSTYGTSDSLYSNKVIINFTKRHRNYVVNYFFLKEHQDKLLFAGMKDERDFFCERWGIDIELLEVNNFLELAKIIEGCKFFIGNASMCYQLAEAIKVPRMIELFPLMPNVMPIGESAFDYYSQPACEYYFNELLNV